MNGQINYGDRRELIHIYIYLTSAGFVFDVSREPSLCPLMCRASAVARQYGWDIATPPRSKVIWKVWQVLVTSVRCSGDLSRRYGIDRQSERSKWTAHDSIYLEVLEISIKRGLGRIAEAALEQTEWFEETRVVSLRLFTTKLLAYQGVRYNQNKFPSFCEGIQKKGNRSPAWLVASCFNTFNPVPWLARGCTRSATQELIALMEYFLECSKTDAHVLMDFSSLILDRSHAGSGLKITDISYVLQ